MGRTAGGLCLITMCAAAAVGRLEQRAPGGAGLDSHGYITCGCSRRRRCSAHGPLLPALYAPVNCSLSTRTAPVDVSSLLRLVVTDFSSRPTRLESPAIWPVILPRRSTVRIREPRLHEWASPPVWPEVGVAMLLMETGGERRRIIAGYSSLNAHFVARSGANVPQRCRFSSQTPFCRV
jgi:hypothetical protein